MAPTTRHRRRGAPAASTGRAKPAVDGAQFGVLDRVPAAAAVLDAASRVRYWNRACERLLGWSATDALGRDIRELIGFSSDDEENSALVRTLFVDGESIKVERAARHKDGRRVMVEVHASPLRDEGRNVTGVLGVMIDLTERLAMEDRLSTNESRYRALVQHAPDVILVVDPAGRITYYSPSLTDALGYDENIHGHGILDYVHDEDRERYRDALRQVIERPDHRVQVELRVLASDGTWRWFEASATNPGEQGDIDGIVVNARDVTTRKLAQESAERHAQQQAAVARLGELAIGGVEPLVLFDEAAAAIRSTHDDALVYGGRYHDDDTLELHTAHGWTPVARDTRVAVVPDAPGALARTVGHSCRDPHLEERAASALDPELAGMRSCMEALVRGASTHVEVLGVLAPRPDAFTDDDLHFVESLANVIGSAIQRLRADRELEQVSLRDGLTGLANRALLVDRIDQALARRERHRRRIALLLLNLDRFKLVNETLGHDAGDELLVTLARRIEASVRGEDTVARLGADEFAVLSEQVADVHEAVEIAQRLTRAMALPVRIGAHELVPSVSIGVAVDGIEWQTALDPVREANTALHWAKERGRARFEIYDAGMRQLAAERLEVEADLRGALLTGGLEAWFQPQVSVTSGEIVAAEALVRWRHPGRGVLTPAQFLHVAEDSALIVPLGEQVLTAACTEAAGWLGRPGFPQSVSVNLSAAHLTHRGLDGFVAGVLARTGLPPERLTIEITEGTLLDDVDAALGALHALHGLGVRISVDDFGTGYSSLRYLTQLPVDEVKIDRSFVQVLNGDAAPRAVVSAVVGMAHALGLVVVAEGVETSHQLDVLRELGCDVGQGFLWSAAQPAESFRECLAHRGCHARAAGAARGTRDVA